MRKLSGKQYEELALALLSAYPTLTAIEQMVKYSLDRDLAEITTGENLSEIVFKLIRWGEAQGQLDELIDKAHERRPHNPELDKFYKEFSQESYIVSSLQGKPSTPESLVKPSSANESEAKILGNGKTRLTVSGWLNYFGFERSPFERLEAGSEEFIEPGFLANCFVSPDCYVDILGRANAATSVILCAKRGEGKTACRVMVDFDCQNKNVPDKEPGQTAYVLSVPHIHLREIASEPTLEHHIREIMARAMPQFAELLVKAATIQYNIRMASKNTLADMSWYVDFYNCYLTSQQVDAFVQAGLKIPFDLSVSPFLKNRGNLSPVDHLQQWCQLMNTIGIKAVYILVDGLDEMTSTAADLDQAYRLFAPLITNRELLDRVPHLALKCFLPAELEDLIYADKTSRPELIPLFKLKWTSENLVKLLRARIDYSRRKTYTQSISSGFDEFCGRELYGVIEEKLIAASEMNPRHLLKLCGLMVETHCRENYLEYAGDIYRFTSVDFETASKEFERWRNRLDSSEDLVNTSNDRQVSSNTSPTPEPPKERHFTISHGNTGYTYESIFSPYLPGAVSIEVEDPYIRKPYQILNFVRFCEMIVKLSDVKHITLFTGYDDAIQKTEIENRLGELKQSLSNKGVAFKFNFDLNLHDREIRIDNGWVIKIGRGLDFYQRPLSMNEIGVSDLELRKCLETKVDIFKA